MDMDQFVIDNFGTALENNHIQVYYQPVIRTISRKLCSFEGLARWIDPEHGMIRPDQFIPVLEKTKKIHLLDRHIIHEVCMLIRKTLDAGSIPIPVSINLSRLDFSLCDIFNYVEEAVTYFKVPHEFLYIEITESIMAEQAGTMVSAVNQFRDSGYQVWMDDFGSAYSSLNVLKDFSFDEIKLDMRFLSSLNQRSRRILAAVIQMAKEINICTLAEGVETEEQFTFLRDIGCEKVQGYYFGKPMPYVEELDHLKKNKIFIEMPNERNYYDDLGKVNLLSAVPFMTKAERDTLTSARQLNSIPLALAEGHENHFRILFFNSAFEDTVKGADMLTNVFSLSQLGEPMPYSLLPASVVNLMDSTRSGEEGRMYFISNEEYYEIQAKCVSMTKDKYCVLFKLMNISQTYETDKTSRLDAGLKQIYSLFERITLIDMKTDTITPLYVSTREDLLSGRSGIASLAAEYARRWVVPEDREKYLAFAESSTLKKRLQGVKKMHISRYFRVYTRHGQYAWKRITFLYFNEDMYLELIRDAHAEVKAFIETHKETEDELLDNHGFAAELLWKTLTTSDILRLFWKDENRRFVGVSKAFLDYYGFKSVSDVIGKTDEDLGWHIRPDQYMNDERGVIHEGITTRNVPGRCISNGENRDILASKTPIYNESGEIKGLIGYFIDKELLTINDTRGAETTRRDLLTGLLNSRGIAEEAQAFQDEYYLRNVDFVRIHVSIDDFSTINSQYGYDFGDKAIAALGRELKRRFGKTSAIGRYSGHLFVILRQVQDAEEARQLRKMIKDISERVSEVDHIPITLYLSVGYTLYSEFEDLDEQMKHSETRLLADHSVHTSIEARLMRASELFSMYDNLPVSVSVYKAIVNTEDEVVDAEIMYVNRRFEQEAQIKAEHALGKTTRKLFPYVTDDWYEDVQKAAMDGKSVERSYYNEPADTLYHVTLSQVIHPGYCCVTCHKAVEKK